MPKERPIIISTPLISPTLEGNKTQTRRMMKPQPKNDIEKHFTGNWCSGLSDDTYECIHICPYGQVGDRLWVRETWRLAHASHDLIIEYKADNTTKIVYWADYPKIKNSWVARNIDGKWRPSIHIPRWASRIMLEITDIRVQQIQDISEEDALAEGVPLEITKYGLTSKMRNYTEAFIELWDDINFKRGFGWESNPWVWAITFRKLEEMKGG